MSSLEFSFCTDSDDTLEGFGYLANIDARVLVLGSMPGQRSLHHQEYYAHPRNTFWDIVAELFGISRSLPYDKRVTLLCDAGVALWDVVYRCRRRGSLDSDIEKQTIRTNDFSSLFEKHPDIHTIFFNGRMAAQLYHKHVLPSLPESIQLLPACTLPSTSPANASIPVKEKLVLWAVIKQCIKQ